MRASFLICLFFVSIFIIPSLVFAQTSTTTASPSSTVTSTSLTDNSALIKQLQAFILSLQTQINELKAKLEATQKDVEIVKSEIQFTKSLARGAQGDEVKQLQEVLKEDPEVYPEGKVTGFFGPATEAAVKRFQEKHGFESLGTIGPKTRQKLNELIIKGAGKSGVIPPGLEKRFGTATAEQTYSSTPSGTIPAQPVGQTGTTTIPAMPGTSATTTVATSPVPSSSPAPLTNTSPTPTPSSTPIPNSSLTPTPSPSPSSAPLASCLSVDFEDDPYVGSNITNTPSHISWINSKGLDITGTPSGYVWTTRTSGGAGQSGVVVGFGSPDFSERDQGVSDNEILSMAFLNQSLDTVTVTLASIPSSESVINNQPSTVIMDAFDSAGTFLGSVTKTFTGVTNGVYTPSTISLSVAQATIKKITLRATQHPYGGVWIKKVACGISSSPSPSPTPSASTTPTTSLSTPTNLTAVQVKNWYAINLTWSKSTGSTGVVGYKVYRNGTQIFSAATSSSLSTLTYCDCAWNTPPSTITFGTTYFYTVAAYDAAGNVSTQSSAVLVTPVAEVDTTAPIISNIKTNNITQTTTNISWTTNEVSTSDVYYSSNSSVLISGTLRATITGNVTSHSITLSSLSAYLTYYYLVVSKDEAGNTATSSINNFQTLAEPVVTPTTRTITATAGTGGTISPSGSVVVTQGINKAFTISANTGYTISSVAVDGINQGAISTYTFINVQTAHTISATFVQITYAITATQGANGTISPSTASVISGGGQVFTIAPATGYQIASVSVDGVNQGAVSTYTFTNVTATHTITATFSLIPIVQYTITVTQGINGTITPGTTSVTSGGNQTFTITPATGYQISNLIVDGSNVASAGTYTFTNVTSAHTISFISSSPTPSPSPSPSASPSPSPSIYALTAHGRVVNAITNQPVINSDMYFWNWKGSTRRDFPLQSDGSFLINLTADDVANASPTYVNSVFNKGNACYDQSFFSLVKTPSGSIDYINVGEMTGSNRTVRKVTPVGSDADIGDMLVWPVTGFNLTSDIPVRFDVIYQNGTSGGGNSLYKTSHGFSTIYAVNTPTSIVLTDQAGKKYASQYVTYGLSQHCSQVTLNFANGQFSWSPPGTLTATTTAQQTTRESLLASLSATLKALQAAIAALAR